MPKNPRELIFLNEGGCGNNWSSLKVERNYNGDRFSFSVTRNTESAGGYEDDSDTSRTVLLTLKQRKLLADFILEESISLLETEIITEITEVEVALKNVKKGWG